MSTVIAPPKPGKPWKATPKQRAITAGIYLAAALVSYVVVATTPMKGKLAYFTLFFFASIIIDFAASFVHDTKFHCNCAKHPPIIMEHLAWTA